MSEQCNFEECHTIIEHSKANVLIIDRHLDARSNFMLWIENTSYEEYKEYRDDGLNISAQFPIEGVPVGISLDGETTKEDYEKLQSYFKKGMVESFSENQAIHIISQVVPPNVYDNWLSCMNNMMECVKNQKYGLHHEVRRTGNELIIKIWYYPYNPQDPWPKVSSDVYVPDGAQCKHDCLKEGDTIEREVTLIFVRSSGENGTISINTDKGAILVPLVPYLEGNPNVNLQENIKQFIQQAYISEGGKISGYDVPAAPKEHESYLHFDDVIIDIENFTGSGTTIECNVIFKRNISSVSWLMTATKDLNTGEETIDWRKDIGGSSPITVKISISIDYSKNELGGVIFCATPQEILNKYFQVTELCLSGKELASRIIEWLES